MKATMMMSIGTAIVKIEDQIEAWGTIESYPSFGFACSVSLGLRLDVGELDPLADVVALPLLVGRLRRLREPQADLLRPLGDLHPLDLLAFEKRDSLGSFDG